MNLSRIKAILSRGKVDANEVNPIIDSLDIQDLDKLSSDEAAALSAMIHEMLRLVQDSSSGAHLVHPEKATSLLEQLSIEST